MRARLSFLAALGAGALLIAACSDDDSNASTPPGSGVDAAVPPANPTGDAATNPDGGCTFAGYVIDLVQNHTTATEKPASDLGDSCTPSTAQGDFAGLF